MAGDIHGVTVPDSLRSLIAARLDSLSASDRALLQDGAVLGQSFTSQALAAITNRDRPDLDGALLLLASDAGRYIAGTTIVVDGAQMVALRG